jgi:hypothetical protein
MTTDDYHTLTAAATVVVQYRCRSQGTTNEKGGAAETSHLSEKQRV